MKKLVMTTIVLVAAWTSVALGQDTEAKAKKGSLYAGVGVGLPMSPSAFSDNWGTGFGGGAGLGYLFTPMVEGVALFDYGTYSIDAAGAAISGGDVITTEFIADVKFIFNTANTASKFRPYLVVGVGMASVKISEATSGGTVISPETSESAIALRGGAGTEIWVSPKVAIFADFKYTTVSTEGESTAYLPIRAGAKIPIF